MRLPVLSSTVSATERFTLSVHPQFWGSYALSVQARNQNASNSAVFNEIATSLTASCQDSPWASRLSINVPVFFLIRALEVHCLHRKCVRTPRVILLANSNEPARKLLWLARSARHRVQILRNPTLTCALPCVVGPM